MKQKDYALYSALVFLLIFVVHGLRIILGWEGVVAGWEVPMWVSWIAVALGAFFAYNGFKLSGKIK